MKILRVFDSFEGIQSKHIKGRFPVGRAGESGPPPVTRDQKTKIAAGRNLDIPHRDVPRQSQRTGRVLPQGGRNGMEVQSRRVARGSPGLGENQQIARVGGPGQHRQDEREDDDALTVRAGDVKTAHGLCPMASCD